MKTGKSSFPACRRTRPRRHDTSLERWRKDVRERKPVIAKGEGSVPGSKPNALRNWSLQALNATELWRCPACARTFANRNQTHTCAPLVDLGSHFAHGEPNVRELFDAFVDVLRSAGPFEILPEKTRIAFHVRMSFAQLTPRRRHLNGHLVLRRRAAHPLITKVEFFSPRCVLHHFRVEDGFDEAFAALIREAYGTGTQR